MMRTNWYVRVVVLLFIFWTGCTERTASPPTTVEQFIDHVASASSLTGEPYRVRLANRTEVSAADYLREKRAQLEASGSKDLGNANLR
jgi:hypothetical protein